MRQYYAVAGLTVAMREGTTFSYFLTDHLGLRSVHTRAIFLPWFHQGARGAVVGVADSSGTLVAETRYLPFGETRTDVGVAITQTDFGYTFQRNLPDTGLMDYKARFYDPSLGRFIQPDTLVPTMESSQALNRYAYVNNNPINRIDPSGNRDCDADGKNCLYYDYVNHKADIKKFIYNNSSAQVDNPKDVEQLHTSQEGEDFIKDWEQKSLSLYDNDGANNCTIGYGHLVHFGRCTGYDPSETPYINGIDDNFAEELFRVDLANKGENIVKKYVKVPLYQNQFDALVSFAYNVGEGFGSDSSDPNYVLGFSNSNLLEYVNSGQFNLVPSELNKWIYPLSAPGLVIRRRQEGVMFSESIYDSAH